MSVGRRHAPCPCDVMFCGESLSTRHHLQPHYRRCHTQLASRRANLCGYLLANVQDMDALIMLQKLWSKNLP